MKVRSTMPISTKTMAIQGADSLFSTVLNLSDEKGKEISIELRYYLKEGKYECDSRSKNDPVSFGEIIFYETINGTQRIYKSSADTEDPTAADAPGESIEIFDFDGQSWSIKFGGTGDELTPSGDKYYGRCGVGTVTNLYL